MLWYIAATEFELALNSLCVSYIFCHKESVKGFELSNLLQIVILQVHTYLFPHQLDHQHFTVKWRFVQLDVDWINPRLVSFPTGYYWKSYYFFNIFQIYKFQYCSSVVYTIAFVCFKPIWYSLQTKVTLRERLITTCVIASYLADVDKSQLFACIWIAEFAWVALELIALVSYPPLNYAKK